MPKRSEGIQRGIALAVDASRKQNLSHKFTQKLKLLYFEYNFL